MKIAFWGLRQAFDYFQIGGVESFVRRLAAQMVQEGKEVDYILYGNDTKRVLNHLPGLTLRYFKSFKEAIDAINSNYDHVITVYLLPKERAKYFSFRKKNNHTTSFHFIYFGWPDSLIKRTLYFHEAKLFPYNGKLFCISKRQYEYVRKWAKNAVYILPPVPESYFLRPEEKPINDKIKITFLGRIDPGKGIDEVIEIFKAVKENNRFECSIYGIHIPEHKESLNIHNWLKSRKDIKYIEVDRHKYSPDVEEFVRTVLKETDIFIQPYQKLSSTIDTPLLLLETMASLCAVITKPFGNISDIYGESRFVIRPEKFVTDALEFLKSITADGLCAERERIYKQNLKLHFKSGNIAERFLKNLMD